MMWKLDHILRNAASDGKAAMGREFVCNPRTRVEIVFFPRYSHAYISKYVQNHKKVLRKMFSLP